MTRLGPPEPSEVKDVLPLDKPEGENTNCGNIATGNGYMAMLFLFAKSTPSGPPFISELVLWRVYPTRASLTTAGEKTCVSSRMELIVLLVLFDPPPMKPAKLPGLTLF